MAPRSSTSSSRQRTSRHDDKPMPTLIIPCLTPLPQLYTRFRRLDIRYNGNITDIFGEIEIFKNTERQRSNKAAADKNETKSKTPNFKKPQLSRRSSSGLKTSNANKDGTRNNTSTDKSSDGRDRSAGRSTRTSGRARSSTPPSIPSPTKRPRGIPSKQTKQAKQVIDEDAKPGTVNSREALVAPKRNQKAGPKRSLKNGNEEDSDKCCLTKIVDEAILFTLAQLAEKHQIKDMPKEPLDFCQNFSIIIPDLNLQPSVPETKTLTTPLSCS